MRGTGDMRAQGFPGGESCSAAMAIKLWRRKPKGTEPSFVQLRNVAGDQKDDNKEAKPRSLRFTWSMKTTSSMDPNDMMREIRKVLDANNCDYEQRERFLLFCVHGDGHAENLVQWEMEGDKICPIKWCPENKED
ncbi:UNVERIFIED_CONTAM: MAP/microtubule affinity-regulating kinase 3 [Gekko kuhli]